MAPVFAFVLFLLRINDVLAALDRRCYLSDLQWWVSSSCVGIFHPLPVPGSLSGDFSCVLRPWRRRRAGVHVNLRLFYSRVCLVCDIDILLPVLRKFELRGICFSCPCLDTQGSGLWDHAASRGSIQALLLAGLLSPRWVESASIVAQTLSIYTP